MKLFFEDRAKYIYPPEIETNYSGFNTKYVRMKSFDEFKDMKDGDLFFKSAGKYIKQCYFSQIADGDVLFEYVDGKPGIVNKSTFGRSAFYKEVK